MLGKYKIRVNTKAESKEAQELLFELGYYWAYRSIGKKFFYEESDVFLFANVDGVIGTGGIENTDFFNSNSAKEITLPQLRDLVTKSKKEKGSADQRYIKYQKGLQILFLYSRFNSNLILSSEGFTLSSKYFIFIFITHGISNIHTMISNTL